MTNQRNTNLSDLSTDYIIENGSNNKGNYIKWNSGLLIMWGSLTYVETTNTIQTQTVTFPVNFMDTNYRMQLTLTRNGNVCSGIYECNSSGNVERQNYGSVTRINKSASNYSVDANWLAIGKWK